MGVRAIVVAHHVIGRRAGVITQGWTINAITVLVYAIGRAVRSTRVPRWVRVIAVVGSAYPISINVVVWGGRITVVVLAVIGYFASSRTDRRIRVITVPLIFRVPISVVISVRRICVRIRIGV